MVHDVIAIDPTPGVITYRLVGYRPLIFVVFSVLGLGGVALVANLLSGSEGPGLWFVIFWLTAYAWNAYWGLFRIAYELSVLNGLTLRWCSVMRCREIPLSSLKGIQTAFPPFGVGLKKIVVEDELSPMLMASLGFREVVATLLERRPDLVMKERWYDLLAERFTRRSLRWRQL